MVPYELPVRLVDQIASQMASVWAILDIFTENEKFQTHSIIIGDISDYFLHLTLFTSASIQANSI